MIGSERWSNINAPCSNSFVMYGATLEKEDIVLLQVLMRDSRATAKQIAGITGLKVGEIPERVARMREAGVIGDLTVKPSLVSLGANSVMVVGRSRSGSLRQARPALEHNDNVAWMAMASGGMMYVALHLLDLRKMDAEVRKVASQAMMVQPKILLRDLFDPGLIRHVYTPDDLRILGAMYRDANMDLAEVSRTTGLDPGKVRSRFDEMAEKGALDFSVDFLPDRCDNLLTMLRLEVVETRGLEGKVGWLMEVNSPYLLFFNTFSSHPHTVTCMALPESLGALRSILLSFEDSGAFAHVEADLILESSLHGTWRDRMVQQLQG